MKQSGRQLIKAPRQKVWQALNDTSVLKRCIDGCESFEQVAPGRFNAKVRARIGPVNALFAARVSLVEEPSMGADSKSFRLELEIERAPAGFGKGEASVKLVDQPAQATLITYEINAVVGGKLAQLGARLIDSAAAAMASAFFGELQSVLAGEAARAHGRERRWLPWATAGLVCTLAILAFAMLALR